MLLFASISFIAGFLTVLAPCILPVLPVIVGGSVANGSNRRAYTVIISLVISVLLFTLLLKVSSLFINVPPEVWKYISGGILGFIGLTMLFPSVWESIPFIQKLSISSNKVLGSGMMKKNFIGDIIMGASLGPVFSTCSPTYFVILATVLPVNFTLGLFYMVLYAIGLGLALLLISIFGQKLANKLGIVSDNRGTFKKVVGLIFILVALFIGTGTDKKVQVAFANSIFDITKVEQVLLAKSQDTNTSIPISFVDETASSTEATSTDGKLTPKKYPVLGMYKEITNPAGYVNTNGQPIKLADYVGKKIIVIDFLTYSCINCIRTFPYLNDWYAKYKDKGLVIVGIHTPEFAFERKQENVEKALAEYGIKFPVVLDNNYGTWTAYGNQYWPRKYIIDLKGNIVYDHIGEGGYDETEEVIKYLLMTIPSNTDVENTPLTKVKDTTKFSSVESQETYLGYARQSNNSTPLDRNCDDIFCKIDGSPIPDKNTFSFIGTWKVAEQYAEGSKGAKLVYHFKASKVHLVTGSQGGATVRVTVDGGTAKDIKVHEEKLYTLVDLLGKYEDKTVTIEIIDGTLDAYAFTFG